MLAEITELKGDSSAAETSTAAAETSTAAAATSTETPDTTGTPDGAGLAYASAITLTTLCAVAMVL